MRDGISLIPKRKIQGISPNVSAFLKHGAANDRTLVSKRDPHYWHEYYIPAGSFSPGASGATWVDPSASTLGGYRLDVNTEYLFYHSHIEPDWDGLTDPKMELYFEVNVNNTGGADTDTVDLSLLTYYKAEGDTADRTQTVEVATIVGKSAQYKLWKAELELDWDLASHVILAGDVIGMRLNLETDTSEVDNIIVVFAEFKYKTWKPAPEVNP